MLAVWSYGVNRQLPELCCEISAQGRAASEAPLIIGTGRNLLYGFYYNDFPQIWLGYNIQDS